MESPFKRRRVSRNDIPVAELHERRVRNDLRLKSAFESIFEKYGKDFSGIGDEIDLETGEIVVDRGHVLGMKNETDPGCEEDMYDELNPEYWSCKDASKLSVKSLHKPCPSAVSRLLPEERPALEPTWRAPPLPKGSMNVQEMAATPSFSPDQTEEKRSPSPAGVSLWALDPSDIYSKKSKQKKDALPSHPKHPVILPNTEKRKIVSATDVPSLTRVSLQSEPEQISVRSMPLKPPTPSATSKSTATPVWTREDDMCLKLNRSSARLDLKRHRREVHNELPSNDEAYAPKPKKNQHPLVLAEARQEPAMMIQSEVPNLPDPLAYQPLEKQEPRSSKLLNDPNMTSSMGSRDKNKKQIKRRAGHSTDTLENARVIALEKIGFKHQAHLKQTRASTLPEIDSGTITSTHAQPHELAKPNALPIPKVVPQKATRLQTKSHQNSIELKSQPILPANPPPQTRPGSLKRTKFRGIALGRVLNMGIKVPSDSSVPKFSRDTPNTANEKSADDFWDPPSEYESPRAKKNATPKMCNNCFTQDTYIFDKLCSACSEYKRKTKSNRPASVIESRRHSNRHSDSHELVQKRKTENETKASRVSPPLIATSQAKPKDKLILPKQILDLPSTPNSFVAPSRLLALEDVSEDELSTPVKTVGIPLPISMPKMSKLNPSCASNSGKRILRP